MGKQFVRQWGVNLPPFLEEPLGVVLREALLDCITPDGKRLALIDVLQVWLNFNLSQTQCEEIACALRNRCKELDVDLGAPTLIRALESLEGLVHSAAQVAAAGVIHGSSNYKRTRAAEAERGSAD